MNGRDIERDLKLFTEEKTKRPDIYKIFKESLLDDELYNELIKDDELTEEQREYLVYLFRREMIATGKDSLYTRSLFSIFLYSTAILSMSLFLIYIITH